MTDEVRNELHRKFIYIYDVKEILDNFFGEDRVDIVHLPELNNNTNFNTLFQSYTCYIHFPQVTVTNEENRSTVIYDLFVKFELKSHGVIGYDGIEMTRSTYTEEQAKSNYTHSHLPRNIGHWNHPCLGTGPIRNTIGSLQNGYDENLWNLFCVELNLYVQTESLLGGPYIRLDSIGGIGMPYSYRDIRTYCFPHELRRGTTILTGLTRGELLDYVIEKQLIKFNYVDGQYRIACSDNEFAIIISNAAILLLKNKGINNWEETGLIEFIHNNGLFYYRNSNTYNLEAFNTDRTVLTFKGRNIKLKLKEPTDKKTQELNYVHLLSSNVLSPIYNILTNLVNYKYGYKTRLKNGRSFRYI